MPRQPDFLRYALLALVAALFYIGLLIWQADTLVRLGLEGRLFFMALIPLGVAVAAILFDGPKSHATYKGEVLGGKLKLGGPVLVFFLLPILGFWLTQNPPAFAVTVYVQRADLANQPVASGRVVLILGGDPRGAEVSTQGAAFFSGIPAHFRGQAVPVRYDGAAGYEAAQDRLELDAEGVYLAVRARPALFTGYIVDEQGKPIAGARIGMSGHETRSGDNGYFKLTLPGPEVESGATLQILAPGYAPWSGQAVAGGSEIRVKLER
ncbi:MAG: hypothetical protein Q8Q28_15810 [Pseudomonadota bacterium]|nr:hypothetical protein [Pseudomonadota bacterium]